MMLTSLGRTDCSRRVGNQCALKPEAQNRLLDDIDRVLSEKRYSGIEFDFEYIDAAMPTNTPP